MLKRIGIFLILFVMLCNISLADVINYTESNYPSALNRGHRYSSTIDLLGNISFIFYSFLFVVMIALLFVIIKKVVKRDRKNIVIYIIDLFILMIFCYLPTKFFDYRFGLFFTKFKSDGTDWLQLQLLMGSIIVLILCYIFNKIYFKKPETKKTLIIISIIILICIMVPVIMQLLSIRVAFVSKNVNVLNLYRDIIKIKMSGVPLYANRDEQEKKIEPDPIYSSTDEQESGEDYFNPVFSNEKYSYAFFGYKGDGYYIKYYGGAKEYAVLIDNEEIYSFKERF